MRLYVVRHAWAIEASEAKPPVDAERTLTQEGSKRFTRLMQKLVRRGFFPEIVATSPLVRCKQTAEIICQFAPRGPQLVTLKELSPGASVARVLPKLDAWKGHAEVAWVGHSPDVGRMTAELLGAEHANIKFSKGAIAAIDFDGMIESGQGELQWLLSPRILGE